MTIRGGVSNESKRATMLVRSHAATVIKRVDDRIRLQLEHAWDVREGERLLIDSDYETLSGDVYAVHLDNALIDLRLRAPLDLATKRVHLRRRDA